MLIGRANVEEVIGHERSHMVRHDFLGGKVRGHTDEPAELFAFGDPLVARSTRLEMGTDRGIFFAVELSVHVRIDQAKEPCPGSASS